ncbi:MAG: TraR/DksA family transcriptional regulator [Planctomycetota bacterium]
MDDVRREQVRTWLLGKLQELTQGVAQNMDELAVEDAHHLADLEELASDVSVADIVFEQFRSSADTIAQIERALERLDDGTYESCDDCGGAIGAERMEALPFATQCIDCKRIAERATSHE